MCIRDSTPTDLNMLLETGNGHRPLVVDVREAWEFAQGHVPGARLISLGELAGRVGELDTTTPVALICATGSRSQSAAALLGQKGFETVYNVDVYKRQVGDFPINTIGEDRYGYQYVGTAAESGPIYQLYIP